MLRIALLVLSLVLPTTLWAQYVSGTVVVLEEAGDYIVIAADSLRLGPGPGQVSHTACKIVKLSDQLVFVASGLSGHPGIAKTPGPDTWNVDDIARQEYTTIGKRHAGQLIQKLAAAYGERLSGQINHDLRLEPEGPLMTYLTKQGGGGAALFAGFDEKHQHSHSAQSVVGHFGPTLSTKPIMQNPCLPIYPACRSAIQKGPSLR